MKNNYGLRQKTGLFLGPLLMIILLVLPGFEGLSPEGRRVLAITGLMAVYWVTEAIPIPATALFPILLFPMFNVMPASEAAAPYANKLIYLFLGGFMVAVAMEKWNLHKRIALNIISIVGTSPKKTVLGFMIATAFLSMWISNTATAMMMVPIGIAVVSQVVDSGKEDTDSRNFATALMIGIAYSASIGGVGTIIGTPPNTVMAGMINTIYDRDINFLTWMTFGVPVALVMLGICWYVLVHLIFPLKFKSIKGESVIIRKELDALGKIKKEEKLVLIVFSLMAFLWIFAGISRNIELLSFFHEWFPKYDDSIVAILGALLLFMIPSDFKKGNFLLDWESASKIPWGIIILFGGGLSLASAYMSTDLANFIAGLLSGFSTSGFIVMILIITTTTIFLTEVTSNTATSTMLMPVMASHAVALGAHPYALMATAAISASMAFMLPVATPPNAVVFGSGRISVPQMAKAGIWMNIIAIIIITASILWLLPLVWGIDIGVMPDWAK